jgi:hypothetical protein
MLKKFTENELQQKYTDKRMNIINDLKVLKISVGKEPEIGYHDCYWDRVLFCMKFKNRGLTIHATKQ